MRPLGTRVASTRVGRGTSGLGPEAATVAVVANPPLLHVEPAMSRFLAALPSSLLLVGALLCAPGCDQQEKVVDVETPGGSVEVEREPDSGSVDVDVNE